jgi:hypothetical protein
MNHCGCNDWQSSHRRSMLRRQGQVVPIPRAVLEGESAGMCRRDFLRNGAVAFLTVYGASMLDWGHIWEAASAQAATPGTDPAWRWAERLPTPTGPGTRPRPASSSCTTPARSP